MKELDLSYRTMFAELQQRCLDAAFEADFPLDGRFVKVTVKGREYWYFDRAENGKNVRKYVGPQNDGAVAERVAAFREIKDDLKARRKLVSTLTREARLEAPDRFAGEVVSALAKAGLFRLRGVLIGTMAFQCYSGLLGIRLPRTASQTGDADFAQFHSISAAIGDSAPNLLEALQGVDPSFRALPHQADAMRSTAYENAARFKVEFLTPNRGKADYERRPATMPALGGAAALPLRFLDFLIHEPVRSVMLHGGGAPVIVPTPERFAIHKLIVATRRRSDAVGDVKRDKDVLQADALFEAVATVRRQSDLALAFSEAWARGAAWRKAITIGLSYLPSKRGAAAKRVLTEGLRDVGERPENYQPLVGLAP